MKSFKKVVSIILLVSMIFTSNAFYTLAEGNDSNDVQTTTIETTYQDEADDFDNQTANDDVSIEEEDSDDDVDSSIVEPVELQGEGQEDNNEEPEEDQSEPEENPEENNEENNEAQSEPEQDATTIESENNEEEQNNESSVESEESSNEETSQTEETTTIEENTTAEETTIEETTTTVEESTSIEETTTVAETTTVEDKTEQPAVYLRYFGNADLSFDENDYSISNDNPPISGVDYDTWTNWVNEASKNMSDKVAFTYFLFTDKPIDNYDDYYVQRSIYHSGDIKTKVINQWHDFCNGFIKKPIYIYACYDRAHWYEFKNDDEKGTYNGRERYADEQGDIFNEDKEQGLFKAEPKDGYKFVGWRRNTDNQIFTGDSIEWLDAPVLNWDKNITFESVYIEDGYNVHVFNKSWRNKITDIIADEDITKITIEKSNEEPNSDKKVDLNENGLAAYVVNDTEVIIHADSNDDIFVDDADSLFYNFENLKEISGLGNLNTSETTNFDQFVFNDKKLEKLDFENLDTSSINSAKLMFCQTYELKKIDLSNFNPNANKFYAKHMFNFCGIEKVDLTGRANFKGQSTDVFNQCKNLTEAILKDSDTSEWEDLYNLFSQCEKLERVDMSNCDLNTSYDTDSHRTIFQYCESLKEIIFDGVKFPRDSANFFYGLDQVEVISIKNADFSKTECIKQMFMSCKGIKKVDLSNCEFPKLNNSNGLLLHCEGLEELDLSGINLDKFNNTSAFFIGTEYLDSYDEIETITKGVKVLKLNNVTLSDKRPLSNIRLFNSQIIPFVKRLEMKNVVFPSDCKDLFSGFINLESIDLSGADVSKVGDMGGLFKNCKKLKKIDLTSFDTSSLYNLDGMFTGCESLEEIDGLQDFNTALVKSISNMFKGCSSLKSVDLSNWQTTKLQYASDTFNGCTNLENIKLFTAHNLRVFDNMFANCESIKKLDLTTLEVTKKATEIDSETNTEVEKDRTAFVSATGLLDNCLSIEELDLSSFHNYAIDLSTLTNLQTLTLSEAISTAAKDMNISGNWINVATNETVNFSSNDFTQTGVVQYTKTGNVSVTFNVGNGSKIPNVNVSVGDTIKFSNYKDKSKYDGHKIVGWYKEETFENEITDDFVINSPIIVYAKWERLQYNVNLIIDSNKFASWRNEVLYKNGTPSEIKKYGEDTYVLPTKDDFVSTGWDFDGWYDNYKTNGDKILEVPANTFNDTTYYAKFTKKKYTITYELNGGKFVTEESQWPEGFPSFEYDIPYEYEYHQEIILPTTVEGPNENEFLRAWYLTPDFSGEPITNRLPYEISENIKLYAKYDLRHKVIYNPNESHVTGRSAYKTFYQYFFEDEDVTLMPVMFGDAMYEFVEWRDNDGNVYKDKAHVGYRTEDLYLTGVWKSIGIQSAVRIRRTGGSGGGGGGGGGSALPTNNNKPLLPNEGLPVTLAEEIQFTNPQQVHEIPATVTNGVDSGFKGQVHVNNDGVNWVYNAVDNSWSLSNKGELLKDGFYKLTRTDDYLINNKEKWQVYYDLDVYCFDKNGKMVTGWVNDTMGNTYFFENTPNSICQGMRMSGLNKIQGDIYYFNPLNGAMVKNQEIEGYIFGADGKLTNPH